MRGYRVWVLAALVALFLAGRVYVLLGGRVFTSYDTYTYALRGDPAIDRGPVVSLLGHSPRLPGAPVFYALFPSDGWRAGAQWTVGTIAWTVLAVGVWLSLRTLVARVAGAGAVLALGLTPQVTNWDFAILSESLSIGLGVLALGCLLLWRATGARVALGGAAVAGAWWSFVRPETRLPVVLLAGVLLWLGWRVFRRPGWVPPVLAAGVLLVSVGWVTAITPTVTHTFPGWSATGLSLEEETLNYRLRLTVLPSPETARVFREELGMPDCPAASAVAAGSEWAIAAFAAAYRGCPELKAWGEANATSSGYRYALAAPGQYADFLGSVLPRSLAGTVYADVPSTPASPVLFPARERVVLLLGVPLVVLLGLGVIRRGVLWWAALAVTAVSVATLLAGLSLSAGEYARFGIQEAVGLRVALILLVVATYDVLSTRAHSGTVASHEDSST